MTLYKGSTKIGEIYKGSTPIVAIYKGSQLIWSAGKKVMLLVQAQNTSNDQKTEVIDTGFKVKDYNNRKNYNKNINDFSYIIDDSIYSVYSGNLVLLDKGGWTSQNIKNDKIYSGINLYDDSKLWKYYNQNLGIDIDGNGYVLGDNHTWNNIGKNKCLFSKYLDKFAGDDTNGYCLVCEDGIYKYTYASSSIQQISNLTGWQDIVQNNYDTILRNGIPYGFVGNSYALTAFNVFSEELVNISDIDKTRYIGLALGKNGTLYRWTTNGTTITPTVLDTGVSDSCLYHLEKLQTQYCGINNAQSYYVKNNKLYAICYDDSQTNPYIYQVDNNDYIGFFHNKRVGKQNKNNSNESKNLWSCPVIRK